MRPAREILRDFVRLTPIPPAGSPLSTLLQQANAFLDTADGMTSPPPEGAEFTMEVRALGESGVRLNVHGVALRLSNDEATIIGRELTRLGGRNR